MRRRSNSRRLNRLPGRASDQTPRPHHRPSDGGVDRRGGVCVRLGATDARTGGRTSQSASEHRAVRRWCPRFGAIRESRARLERRDAFGSAVRAVEIRRAAFRNPHGIRGDGTPSPGRPARVHPTGPEFPVERPTPGADGRVRFLHQQLDPLFIAPARFRHCCRAAIGRARIHFARADQHRDRQPRRRPLCAMNRDNVGGNHDHNNALRS